MAARQPRSSAEQGFLSEICESLSVRNATTAHVRDHAEKYILKDARFIRGVLCDSKGEPINASGWRSGPTEAGCKIIGERLKGSGMRWLEDGAGTVATLRALYVSGGHLWDGFWAGPNASPVGVKSPK